MSKQIEIQINNPIQGLQPNAEPSAEPDFVFEFPTEFSGDENGAIFFKLDWQNRRAEDARQRLATIFSETSILQNPSENLTNPSWHDFVNLAREHEDFARFQRSPENLWQQVRQMSEPRIVRDENGLETRAASRFDELVTEMRAKNLPLREFVKSLPPDERTTFEARFQMEKTFGANLFADDGVTPNEAGQTRFREVVADISRAVEPREAKSLVSDFPTGANKSEILFAAKNIPIPESKISNAPQNFNPTVPNNSTLPTAAPFAAPNASANASAALLESPVAHNLTNAAPETKPNSAVTQRDGGMVIGGALISGAFALIENYKNSEHIETRDSRTNESVFSAGGGFAAGATGAMFGAAVGKIVPGAEAAVSGVLGFVSGVMVGVEADKGMRWLGAERNIFIAPPVESNLLLENPIAPNLTLQTRFA